MRRDYTLKGYALLNDLLCAGMITVNVLANLLPIGGVTTAEVSGAYETLFTPAGYTFAIWGVIYLLLLGFCAYQTYLAFTPSHPDKELIIGVGPWFALSCAANIGWIFSWHHRVIPLSMVLMIIILISLVRTYGLLGIGTVVVHPTVRTFLHVPVSIYTGWITIATVANAAVLAVSLGWDGAPATPQFWTAALILIALLLTAAALYRKHDIWYAIVVTWALSGILVRHITFYEASYLSVLIAASISIALSGAYTLYLAIIGKVYR